MSLSHTLLGFLSYAPMTGYDLKKQMDRSTQFFWHAALSQIYPTLQQLEGDGLIAAATVPQAGKPDKKVYSLTPAGRAALDAWLAEPLPDPAPGKDGLLLKLFFSASVEKKTLLARLRHQLDLRRARLAACERETPAHIAATVAATGRPRDGVMWDLIRQAGEERERAFIRWLEAAIVTIDARL